MSIGNLSSVIRNIDSVQYRGRVNPGSLVRTGDYKPHGPLTVSTMRQQSSVSRYEHRRNNRIRAVPDR